MVAWLWVSMLFVQGDFFSPPCNTVIHFICRYKYFSAETWFWFLQLNPDLYICQCTHTLSKKWISNLWWWRTMQGLKVYRELSTPKECSGGWRVAKLCFPSLRTKVWSWRDTAIRSRARSGQCLKYFLDSKCPDCWYKYLQNNIHDLKLLKYKRTASAVRTKLLKVWAILPCGDGSCQQPAPPAPRGSGVLRHATPTPALQPLTHHKMPRLRLFQLDT